MRNPRDFWTGIIYVAFGLTAALLARDYGMGTARKMGPAYFPTILSGILILVGIVALVRSFLKPGAPIGRVAVRGLLLVTGSTILFGLIVHGAGLVVALPALVLVSSCASSHFSWRASLALAAGLTLFCYVIFLKGLGIPLPVLGPWLSR